MIKFSDCGNSVKPLGKTTIRQALVGIFYLTTKGLVCRNADDEKLLLTTVPSKAKGISMHMCMVIKNDLIDLVVVTCIC